MDLVGRSGLILMSFGFQEDQGWKRSGWMCEFRKKSIIQLEPAAVFLHEGNIMASLSMGESKGIERWTVVNEARHIIAFFHVLLLLSA